MHYGFSSRERAGGSIDFNTCPFCHGDSLGLETLSKADLGVGASEGDIIALGESDCFFSLAEAGCGSIPCKITTCRVGQTIVAEHTDQCAIGIETPGAPGCDQAVKGGYGKFRKIARPRACR